MGTKGGHTDDLMHLSCLVKAAPPHPLHACLRQQAQCAIQLYLILLIGALDTSSLCLRVHPVGHQMPCSHRNAPLL